jgi:hypothetical protein
MGCWIDRRYQSTSPEMSLESKSHDSNFGLQISKKLDFSWYFNEIRLVLQVSLNNSSSLYYIKALVSTIRRLCVKVVLWQRGRELPRLFRVSSERSALVLFCTGWSGGRWRLPMPVENDIVRGAIGSNAWVKFWWARIEL